MIIIIIIPGRAIIEFGHQAKRSNLWVEFTLFAAPKDDYHDDSRPGDYNYNFGIIFISEFISEIILEMIDDFFFFFLLIDHLGIISVIISAINPLMWTILGGYKSSNVDRINI